MLLLYCLFVFGSVIKCIEHSNTPNTYMTFIKRDLIGHSSHVLTYNYYQVIRNKSLLDITQDKCKRTILLSCITFILISNTNYVNLNPGPESSCTINPCGTWDQPFTWDDRGIVCDTCEQWYHIDCQSMLSKSYNAYANDSAMA